MTTDNKNMEQTPEDQQIAAYAAIFQQIGKDSGSRGVIMQRPPQERNVPIIGLFRNTGNAISCEVAVGPSHIMGKTFPAEFTKKAQERRRDFLQNQDNEGNNTPDLYGFLKQIFELGRAIKSKDIDPVIIASIGGWYLDEKAGQIKILQEPVSLGYYSKKLMDDEELYATNTAYAQVLSAPLAITFTEGSRNEQRQNLSVFYHAVDAKPYEGTLASLIPQLQKSLNDYQNVTEDDPVEWWPSTSNLCFSVQCRDIAGDASFHVADTIVYANNSVQNEDGTTEYVFENNAKNLALKIMESLSKAFAKDMSDSMEVKNFIAKELHVSILPMRVASFSLSVFKSGKNSRPSDNRFLASLEAHCSKISNKLYGSDTVVPAFLDFPFGRAYVETENGKIYEHSRNTGYRSFIISEGGSLFPMKLRGALILKIDKENRIWIHSFAPAPESLNIQDITLLGFNTPFLTERYSEIYSVPAENRLLSLLNKTKGVSVATKKSPIEGEPTAAPQMGKAAPVKTAVKAAVKAPPVKAATPPPAVETNPEELFFESGPDEETIESEGESNNPFDEETMP